MLAERKYPYDLSLPQKKKSVKAEDKFKLIKNTTKNNISKKSKATLVLTTLFIFSMFMIITYRYNVISEKNLEVQKLKDRLEVAKSELATTQIAVDKVIDVNNVESYAKQQLGMQKPEKSQIVYVNMESEEVVQKASNSNMLYKCLDKIKGVINNIF